LTRPPRRRPRKPNDEEEVSGFRSCGGDEDDVGRMEVNRAAAGTRGKGEAR
jgi:hypothetical protein